MNENISFKRNVAGVELNQNNYITEAGTYQLKIKEIKVDGYDNNSEPIPKVVFSGFKIEKRDGKPFLNEDTLYMIEDKYPSTDNLLWKSKMIQVATGVPESFDFNNLVGRYAIATIKMVQGKSDTTKYYANISGLSYSKANDNLEYIVVADNSKASVPTIEIDEDEIPF